MKSIKGYEGIYFISKKGDVFSVKRPSTSGGILKKSIGDDGYYRVSLSLNGKVKNVKVHHLVASAYLGEKPNYKMVIDHIDNDRTNNDASNLEYVSHRENCIRGQRSKLNNRKTSEYAGVFKSKQKWSAVKSYGGVQYNLGKFSSEESASLAYENATEESCKDQRASRLASQSSSTKGVYYDKSRSKWYAQVGRKFIGRFKTEKEAINGVKEFQRR